MGESVHVPSLAEYYGRALVVEALGKDTECVTADDVEELNFNYEEYRK